MKHPERVCFHLAALKQTFLALGSLRWIPKTYLVRSTYEGTFRGAESSHPLLTQVHGIRAGETISKAIT